MPGGNGEILAAIGGLHEKIDRGTSRLHERLDSVVEGLGTVKTDIAVIQERMPEVPCDVGLETRRIVQNHMQRNAEEEKKSKNRYLDATFKIATAIAIAYFVYTFGLRG